MFLIFLLVLLNLTNKEKYWKCTHWTRLNTIAHFDWASSTLVHLFQIGEEYDVKNALCLLWIIVNSLSPVQIEIILELIS